MSDRHPPLPPIPTGFWQPALSTQHQQQQHYDAQHAQHQMPPPPPSAHASTVPPPFYAYNPSSHNSYPHNTQGNHQPPHESKRRRIHNSNNETPWQCTTCQIFLESEMALQAHTDAHVKCPQCNFTASPKVVNGHFSSVHGKFAGGGFKTVTVAIPGCQVQRFNICVGNHPDDVKKWIQERKKRFPRQQKNGQQQASNNCKKDETGSALGSLLDGYGTSSSEEDDAKNDERPTVAAQKTQQSSEPEKQATVETTTIAESQVSRPPNYRTRPCKYFTRNGSCRNGDACNFIHEIDSIRQQQSLPRKNNKPKNNKRQQRGSSSSSTLLRKLLENDVRREAALSIQLLEYLVDCNYLQKQRNGGASSKGASDMSGDGG